MRLLLISNSTNAGETFLAHAVDQIKSFLGPDGMTALFIPYAGVVISFDEYATRVRNRFREIGHHVTSVHEGKNPVQEIQRAQVIIVGGGNTFHLAKLMQEQDLLDPIRERVLAGIPYIGWSAGSNMACPSIRTTNDMPIVEPPGFHALNLVPFQINPHYLDANPEGHAGETREMRIEEFTQANPGIYVVGLREGTMLRVEGQAVELVGSRSARIFRKGQQPREMGPDEDFTFLL
jgi:dipeptidase E